MATKLQQLHEDDFHVWTVHQARELRRLKDLRLNTGLDLDFEHVAEEVDGLGSEILAGLLSHCTVLVEHLLKLEHSRHEEPRRQ